MCVHFVCQNQLKEFTFCKVRSMMKRISTFWDKCISPYTTISDVSVLYSWKLVPYTIGLWRKFLCDVANAVDKKIVFTLCFYIGPIVRYVATKKMQKIPIEVHGRNLWLFLIKNNYFPKTVPTHLIKHTIRKVLQLYDSLYLMFLHRANFEICGNKKNAKNPFWTAWTKSLKNPLIFLL